MKKNQNQIESARTATAPFRNWRRFGEFASGNKAKF